jgi:hypothetical protein
MAIYNQASPWQSTPQNSLYLEELVIRPIPSNRDDTDYIVETKYRHRPDLLAYDLYGNHRLWWVFAQRNMNSLKDPVYDLEPGLKIKIPKKDALQFYLGV